MGWPKRILLVRHGESEGNVMSPEDISFITKANHKFALTEKGRKQALEMGKILNEKYGKFDSYFCSTFKRTQETLSLMYPEISPIVDSRLNELWGGVWHTMPRERIDSQYPDEKHVREREGEYHYRPIGGQNCADVELLIHSFLVTLRMDHADKNVLISAHGEWMLLFWRIMQNRKIDDLEYRKREDIYENCACAVYEQDPEGNMQLVFDNIVS